MFLTTAGNGSAQKANSIENRRCQQGTACFCVLTNAADREKSAAFFYVQIPKGTGNHAKLCILWRAPLFYWPTLIQMLFWALEAKQASTNSIPRTPSSTVGYWKVPGSAPVFLAIKFMQKL